MAIPRPQQADGGSGGQSVQKAAGKGVTGQRDGRVVQQEAVRGRRVGGRDRRGGGGGVRGTGAVEFDTEVPQQNRGHGS